MIVSVNPELGLALGKEHWLVKLYFKSEELAKNRVEIILYMMQKVLADRIPGVTMAIHDIRSGKFITPTTQIPDMEAMLKGEAAFIETVWNSL